MNYLIIGITEAKYLGDYKIQVTFSTVYRVLIEELIDQLMADN